ncbi:HisJ family histidinol phosphate phosphatase [Erysipelotrichaceae bacterium 5_2_54FAA]|nr:HisJ family histidinol phosphate phosphatase [Erysipelotrichaceae bacterium 5_2_54FAA]
MQNFNYHSHTKRCEHAIGEDEEYVKAAIANGFQVMGFSDHAPYAGVHTPGERMDKEALEGYIASVKALQKKYEKEIEIRIGLEFEYFEDQLLELLEYRDRFDYMIIGQHGPAFVEVR